MALQRNDPEYNPHESSNIDAIIQKKTLFWQQIGKEYMVNLELNAINWATISQGYIEFILDAIYFYIYDLNFTEVNLSIKTSTYDQHVLINYNVSYQNTYQYDLIFVQHELCQTICTTYHGTFDFEHTANQTTFTIRLPIASEQ